MFQSFDPGGLSSGAGVDMTDLRRYEKMEEKTRNALADKILTEEERQSYRAAKNPARYLAVAFSSKESVAKALGTGFRGFSFVDILLRRDELGRPFVLLSPTASAVAMARGITRIRLSVTHEGHYVVTMAVAD